MGIRFPSIAAARRAFAAAPQPRRGSDRRLLLLPLAAEHILIGRRWHMGHSHGDGDEKGMEADGVFRLGLAADVSLAVGKALTGYLSGSTAIIADAAHSVSDVDMGVLMSAPDITNHATNLGHDHNHGHLGHRHGLDLDHPVLALSMTIISISVKEWLYWITKSAGEREGSGLMKANAWHHRADAISSVVALIGVGGAILGVPYLDPLAGLVVSCMILKAGIETGYQSVMELADAGVPFRVLAPIKQTICQVDGVKGCHRLRGRRAGSSLFLDVHIEVDPFLSVSAAHDIGENVRHQIQKSHNQVAEVYIHIDPSYSSCSSAMNGMAPRKSFVSIQKDIDAIVYGTLSSLFPEKMSVEHITWHSLKGNVYLQIQVSMSPDLLIRDAMDIAKVAEKEILKVGSNINQVSIQLRLGHPVRLIHPS